MIQGSPKWGRTLPSPAALRDGLRLAGLFRSTLGASGSSWERGVWRLRCTQAPPGSLPHFPPSPGAEGLSAIPPPPHRLGSSRETGTAPPEALDFGNGPAGWAGRTGVHRPHPRPQPLPGALGQQTALPCLEPPAAPSLVKLSQLREQRLFHRQLFKPRPLCLQKSITLQGSQGPTGRGCSELGPVSSPPCKLGPPPPLGPAQVTGGGRAAPQSGGLCLAW